MSNPEKVCVAFGMYNACDSCLHNIENKPNFMGTNAAPEGTYDVLDSTICQLSKPYWSQFEPIKMDS